MTGRWIHSGGLACLDVRSGSARPGATRQLVVVLHGRGDRPRVPQLPFYGLSRPLRIVMPQAPNPLGDGYSWLSSSVTEGRVAELASSLAEASDRVAGCVRELRDPRVREEPVVAGFSQGGMLAFALAVHHPEVLGRALPVAGWLPPPLIPTTALPRGARRVPIRALHGVDDAIVPLAPTRDAVRALSALGYDVELTEVPETGHEASPALHALFSARLEAALAT